MGSRWGGKWHRPLLRRPPLQRRPRRRRPASRAAPVGRGERVADTKRPGQGAPVPRPPPEKRHGREPGAPNGPRSGKAGRLQTPPGPPCRGSTSRRRLPPHSSMISGVGSPERFAELLTGLTTGRKRTSILYFYSASSNKTETNSIQSPLDAIQLEISRPDVLSRVSRTMSTVIGLNSLSSHFAKHEPNHVPCQARSRHLPLAFLFLVLVSWEMLGLLGPILSSFGADSCTGVPWSVHQAREHQPLPITNVRSLGQ